MPAKPEFDDKADSADSQTKIHVENIGGIDNCEATIPSGGAILTGRNATNRTSLLRAINAVLGGSAASLKSDADSGKVTMQFAGNTYTRKLVRNGRGSTMEGSPYTNDETLVDQFACLLEDTPARRAVEQDEDLRSIIMEPVDTAEIERQIERLTSLRDEIDSEIDEAERSAERIPTLEQRRTQLQKEIASIDEEITEQQEVINAFDADAEAADQAEAFVEELEEKRHRLEETRDQIDHQRSKLEELRVDRESAETELANVEDPVSESDELERRLEGLREKKRRVEGTVSDLTRIIDFNDELLEESKIPVDSDTSDDVTSELDPMSEIVECWTCGSEVARDDIANRLNALRDVIEEKRNQRDTFESDIEEIQSNIQEIERIDQRKATLESKLDDIDRQIEHRQGKLEALVNEAESLEAAVQEAQVQVEETAELRNNDILETYQRVSELQYQRGKLEGELEDVRVEIEACEAAAEEVDDLNERRAEVVDEITSFRTKIDELEKTAVDEFNEHMSAVLERLQYENVERVWIERRSDGTRNESRFELHIVRTSDDGTVYEDLVKNLSESEREVIGLVVALAGFMTHEVYEEVPIMLLDSLEAIDADRIAALIDYLSEFVPSLVVALLPEDEQALPDHYTRIQADEVFC